MNLLVTDVSNSEGEAMERWFLSHLQKLLFPGGFVRHLSNDATAGETAKCRQFVRRVLNVPLRKS